jgi:enoyl-[acyl-carrier-protein] reductase (NADH)
MIKKYIEYTPIILTLLIIVYIIVLNAKIGSLEQKLIDVTIQNKKELIQEIVKSVKSRTDSVIIIEHSIKYLESKKQEIKNEVIHTNDNDSLIALYKKYRSNL